MIRVAVVEDQTIVRQGICELLSLAADFEIVGQASDGIEALPMIRTCRPDVVLLDIRLPRLDGLGVLERLHAEDSRIPVVVLTTFDDDEALRRAARLGASGFLLKDVSVEQLSSALRAAAAGERVLHPTLSATVAASIGPCTFPSLDTPDALTARERAVLRLLAAGCSNREIADALNLAHGTVKNHISSILSKLGVRDRTRAVLRGFELRYL